jgi:uncharacterized protein YjiS (DUF1127 family)
MNAKVPLLPIAGATVLRASLAMLALVMHWLKELARARRHRREASKLAGFDGRMLADIGLTRSDVRDAFSMPFWRDPSELLIERAGDRSRRRGARPMQVTGCTENGFHRPPTDRPARQAI